MPIYIITVLCTPDLNVTQPTTFWSAISLLVLVTIVFVRVHQAIDYVYFPTGPAGNLNCYYTLMLTPKLPMVTAGTVPAASAFKLGKPVPHHCVFQITTTVMMYRLTADDVSLDSLRFGPPRGATCGAAAMDEELDNREEDMHHGSHSARREKRTRVGGQPMTMSQMATTGSLTATLLGAARAYNSGGVDGFLHDAHAGEL